MIPTDVGNGRVEITVSAGYPFGSIATFPIVVSASRGAIVGPVAARVNATGFGDRAPAETLIRNLAVSPITVSAGQRLPTEVAWDGLDEKGARVPSDYYVLVLDFRVDDTGAVRVAKAATTIEIRPP